jgi:uncharacterized membrane protein
MQREGSGSAHFEMSGRLKDPLIIGLGAGFLICLTLLAVQIREITGLPAHPLLLHVPVVLIPILSVAAIALMLRPQWRRRYGVALAVLALIALAFTILTVAAGEAFQGSGQVALTAELEEHARLGEQLRIVMIIFAAAIIFIVSRDQVQRRAGRTSAETSRHPFADHGLRAAITVLAIVALVWVVRTGHQGAKATWPPLSSSQPSRSISAS